MIRRERWLIAALLVIAGVLRLSFLIPGYWQQPWTPHHFDEHILSYEALALWEGVTPREVGWPASPLRLLLSVAYGTRFLLDEGAALAGAPDAERAMTIVSRWIGARVGDAASLYFLARCAGAVLGLAQVALAMVAARNWFGRGSPATVIAGVLAAVSPLAVTHSQLVLADVSGTMFATLLLAMLPRASAEPRLAPWLGVVAALAAASKFHFGIWIVPALVACWRGAVHRRDRVTAAASLLVAFAGTLVALVPWLWTNPALGLKEFAGVVLVKAGAGAGGWAGALANAWIVLGDLGWLLLLGAAPGAFILARRNGVSGVVLVATTAAAVVALSVSAVVFDRYGLVVLPGLLLMASAAWARVVGAHPRVSPAAVAGGLLLAGVAQPIVALEQHRHVNSYHLAHDWIRARVPDGAVVVVYSEDNQYLPMSRPALAACAAYVQSEAAYREKWATNGVRAAEASGRPMELAVLNDERFHAFWCAREALAPVTPGFDVRRFHADPRFRTLSPKGVQDEFEAGLVDPMRGFDVVLAHWPLLRAREPDAIFQGPLGPPLRLYLRPGLALREKIR